MSKASICNRNLDPAWKIKVASYLGGADTLGNPDRSSVLMFPVPDQVEVPYLIGSSLERESRECRGWGGGVGG